MAGTNNLGFDNFYSSTLSSTITASDTVVYINALPSASEGYLVIEPDSTTNREIIYYTSKGANFVTCPSVADGRGVGGTSAASHTSGATVQMNTTAEMLEDIQGGSSNTGMHQYFDEGFSDYVLSGGSITQATGLIASVSSGVAYINGRRLPFNAFSKTMTASKDTYVDLYETDGSNLATVSYTELASGATGSTPVSNGMHLGMVQSHTASLTRIVQSGTDILNNPINTPYPDGKVAVGLVANTATTMTVDSLPFKPKYIKFTLYRSSASVIVWSQGVSIGTTTHYSNLLAVKVTATAQSRQLTSNTYSAYFTDETGTLVTGGYVSAISSNGFTLTFTATSAGVWLYEAYA